MTNLIKMSKKEKKNKTSGGEEVKASKEFKISYPGTRIIEEDEEVAIKEIFDHFDFGDRHRVNTSDLPTILRLLQHNIGEDEDKELRFLIDKKNRGYFTMPDLKNLLQEVQFRPDTQQGLFAALAELDTDADGFIELDQLSELMSSVGEPLSGEELAHFAKVCRDETSDRPTLIDIKRLAQILLPKIVAENELTKGVAKQ